MQRKKSIGFYLGLHVATDSQICFFLYIYVLYMYVIGLYLIQEVVQTSKRKLLFSYRWRPFSQCLILNA